MSHNAKSSPKKVYVPTGLLKVRPGYTMTAPNPIVSSVPDQHVSHSYGNQEFLPVKGIGDDHLPRVASKGGLVSPNARYSYNHSGTISPVARDATLISSQRKILNQKSYSGVASTVGANDYSVGRIDQFLIDYSTRPSQHISYGAIIAYDAAYATGQSGESVNPPNMTDTLSISTSTKGSTSGRFPYTEGTGQGLYPNLGLTNLVNISGASLHFVGKAVVNPSHTDDNIILFIIGDNTGNGTYGVLAILSDFIGMADENNVTHSPVSSISFDMTKTMVVSISITQNVMSVYLNGSRIGRGPLTGTTLSDGWSQASSGIIFYGGTQYLDATLYEVYAYVGSVDQDTFGRDHLYLYEKYKSIIGT